MSEPNPNRKSASRCENPAFNQAEKIIARFGGGLKLASVLGWGWEMERELALVMG